MNAEESVRRNGREESLGREVLPEQDQAWNSLPSWGGNAFGRQPAVSPQRPALVPGEATWASGTTRRPSRGWFSGGRGPRTPVILSHKGLEQSDTKQIQPTGNSPWVGFGLIINGARLETELPEELLSCSPTLNGPLPGPSASPLANPSSPLRLS